MNYTYAHRYPTSWNKAVAKAFNDGVVLAQVRTASFSFGVIGALASLATGSRTPVMIGLLLPVLIAVTARATVDRVPVAALALASRVNHIRERAYATGDSAGLTVAAVLDGAMTSWVGNQDTLDASEANLRAVLAGHGIHVISVTAPLTTEQRALLGADVSVWETHQRLVARHNAQMEAMLAEARRTERVLAAV